MTPCILVNRSGLYGGTRASLRMVESTSGNVYQTTRRHMPQGLNREHSCENVGSYEISVAGYLCVSCNILRDKGSWYLCVSCNILRDTGSWVPLCLVISYEIRVAGYLCVSCNILRDKGSWVPLCLV